MKQFYDTYKGYEKLSTLLREINLTNNLLYEYFTEDE